MYIARVRTRHNTYLYCVNNEWPYIPFSSLWFPLLLILTTTTSTAANNNTAPYTHTVKTKIIFGFVENTMLTLKKIQRNDQFYNI